jgi:hypothetical protein
MSPLRGTQPNTLLFFTVVWSHCKHVLQLIMNIVALPQVYTCDCPCVMVFDTLQSLCCPCTAIRQRMATVSSQICSYVSLYLLLTGWCLVALLYYEVLCYTVLPQQVYLSLQSVVVFELHFCNSVVSSRWWSALLW